MIGVSPQIMPPSQGCPSKSSGFWDKAKEAAKSAGTFIYETPLWVVAAAIIGVALCILFPRYSTPFLGVAGGVVAARLATRIAEVFYPESIREFREKAYSFQEKALYAPYIAFACSLATALICPIGGAVFAAATGLYKGAVVEIDVFKYKQNIRREEFKKPPGSVPALLTC